MAVILAPDPDAVLLIRRAQWAGDPWSGHTALPGGRQSASDPTLLVTAIRETAEEVGLALAPERLLGVLDDVAPRTPVLPPIFVRPFVFLLPAPAPPAPNPEVAHAEWVPLDRLLDPAAYGPARVDVRGEPRLVPAYRLGDAVVWGMTERILTGLLRLLG